MRQNIKEADEILGLKFPVLDNGWVQLVDYCGGDKMIEDFARVSYGKGTRKNSDTRGLIRYLISHKHTSPIECTELSFGMALPIHVARQMVRHRTFSPINEYSARYSEVPEVLYSSYNLNLQNKNNKQGRDNNKCNEETELEYKADIINNEKKAFEIYDSMIKNGVAREIARMHLPLNTYTYWFCKMDLNNLFHLLKLRLDAHAQYEIRQYAYIMACMTKLVAPIAFEAWYDYSFAASNWTRLDKEFANWYYNGGNICSTMSNPTHNEVISAKATKIGMSKRELDEFWQKLTVPASTEFKLDWENAKEASYYEELDKK